MYRCTVSRWWMLLWSHDIPSGTRRALKRNKSDRKQKIGCKNVCRLCGTWLDIFAKSHTSNKPCAWHDVSREASINSSIRLINPLRLQRKAVVNPFVTFCQRVAHCIFLSTYTAKSPKLLASWFIPVSYYWCYEKKQRYRKKWQILEWRTLECVIFNISRYNHSYNL